MSTGGFYAFFSLCILRHRPRPQHGRCSFDDWDLTEPCRQRPSHLILEINEVVSGQIWWTSSQYGLTFVDTCTFFLGYQLEARLLFCLIFFLFSGLRNSLLDTLWWIGGILSFASAASHSMAVHSAWSCFVVRFGYCIAIRRCMCQWTLEHRKEALAVGLLERFI